jgi:predicted transposase YbfD/YdcC
MEQPAENNGIEVYFGEITDPRIERTKRHKLIDIITIALCGVICGAESWVDIEMFGKVKQEWLSTILELPNGIPSHDTFGRVFSKIDPQEFEKSFMEWVRAVYEVTQGQVIAIDGKQLRGSQASENGKKAIYMVSAWASENQIVLGQQKVDEKSNEITAIPELLKLLDIAGCIVTIDAIGTQTEIARAIIEKKGDYLLAVKENQGHLFEDIHTLFSVDKLTNFKDGPYQYAKTTNKDHGRIEIRQCWAISDPEYLATIRDYQRWTGLKSLVRIESERKIGDKSEVQVSYYISSLNNDAKKLLGAKRSHWGVENNLHWVLDIAFDEDHCRVRKDNAPQNFAIIRHMALNLLKSEHSIKNGIKGKRLRCGWDPNYLMLVLSQ